MEAAKAILAGGISVFEITMTIPDAPAVIRALRTRFAERALVGAGTVLDAAVSKELLYSIFIPSHENPLHDGAVIVQNGRIAAAASCSRIRGPRVGGSARSPSVLRNSGN